MNTRRVIIRHEKIVVRGFFQTGEEHNSWTVDLQEFGKGVRSGTNQDEMIWRAENFCRRACLNGPVLLLIADAEGNVRKAIEYRVVAVERDPWEFSIKH